LKACRLFRRRDDQVDGEPRHAGHRSDGHALVFAFNDEERPDQIRCGKVIFTDEAPRPLALPCAAEARRRKSGLWHEARFSVPSGGDSALGPYLFIHQPYRLFRNSLSLRNGALHSLRTGETDRILTEHHPARNRKIPLFTYDR